MKVETLEDILAWTQALHERMSECLAHCATEHDSQRAQWLLTYLADHERSLSHVLERTLERTDAHVLNTWVLDFIGHQPIDPHRTCDAPFRDMTFEQICTAVFDLHNQVIKLYQHVAARADIPDARELLSQLLDAEHHETLLLAQQANRIRDM